MPYDAREHGAQCDECPLRAETPVPPEIRPGLPILVGEGPGEDEVREGAPFVGRSGIELMRGLGAVGRRRQHVSITNACLCPFPDFKLARMEAEVRRANKVKAAMGEPALRSPLECCRPRLLRDIEAAAAGRPTVNVVTLGGTALKALGVEASVTDVRGGPREVAAAVPHDAGTFTPLTLRVLPTVHPAFVLRARRWTRAFHADLGRAFRWFTSGLQWQDPEILYRPTAAQLTAWLEAEAGSPYVVYDVETLPGFPEWDHYDPMHDRLRYIGLGSHDGKRAVGIPLLWVADNRAVYPLTEGKAVVAVLRDFFTSKRWTKAGQNSGYYDRQVIESHFKVTPAPHVDLIGLHKMVEPELPHGLGYIGSVTTDAPSWKDEFDAKAIRTDADMKVYNGRDVAITALAIPAMVRAIKERGQERAARFWPTVQDFCVQLHRNGLPVDQGVRAGWDLRLRQDARHYLKVIRGALGRPSFNPNSVLQLRDLLFEEWQLLPYGKPTESGDPSTGDDTLRAMLGPGYDLTPAQRNTIRAVRRFRATTKLRGTYVVKARPIGQPLTDGDLAFDEEEDSEERETRIEKLQKRPGLVMADGRLHANYGAHGTVGWRLSSSGPNCFDAETQVLTPHGWIQISDLDPTCPVAQWEHGAVSFAHPTAYYREHADRMVTLRNQHIDLRLTPDHRCLLRHRKTGALRVFRADEYPEDWAQIHAGKRFGSGLDLTDDELIVLCAMQADGHWDGSKSLGMDFCFTRQRKIDRLVGALDRLEVPYSRNDASGRTRIRVGAGDLAQRMLFFLGREKQFKWSMLFDMTQAQINTFVEECYLWDGSETRRNCYSSSIRQNAEVFQAACALSGRRAHWRVYAAASGNPNYQVDVVRRDYSMTTNVERRVEATDETVYCLSVPSSYVLVRRGGEIHVTGQCQNLPDDIRDMFVAGPGRIFVGCDEAQLELRMVAGLARAAEYIAALKTGGDPHYALCLDFFGDNFLKAAGGGKKALRRFVKEFTYASFYLAEDETKHRVLTSSEGWVCSVCAAPLDNYLARCVDHPTARHEKRILYPDLTLRDVALFSRKWLDRNIEIETWWETEQAEFRRQGYLAEPIFGMRRDFLDGDDPNAEVNLKAQSGGAALVHLATEIILRELPKIDPTALFALQGHDSVVFEVAQDHPKYVGTKEAPAEFGHCPPGCGCKANRVARLCEDAMRMDGNKWGLDVPFAGEAKIGKTLKEV